MTSRPRCDSSKGLLSALISKSTLSEISGFLIVEPIVKKLTLTDFLQRLGGGLPDRGVRVGELLRQLWHDLRQAGLNLLRGAIRQLPENLDVRALHPPRLVLQLAAEQRQHALDAVGAHRLHHDLDGLLRERADGLVGLVEELEHNLQDLLEVGLQHLREVLDYGVEQPHAALFLEDVLLALDQADRLDLLEDLEFLEGFDPQTAAEPRDHEAAPAAQS